MVKGKLKSTEHDEHCTLPRFFPTIKTNFEPIHEGKSTQRFQSVVAAAFKLRPSLFSTLGRRNKRQCLQSYTAHNDEGPTTASEAHRSWTRTSKDPRPSVSTTRFSSSSSSNHGNGSFRSNDRHKGNTDNPNGQRKEKTNKGREKEENVERYRNSNNRGRREKNADVTEPRKRFMTQEFKDQRALEVDRCLLCKYFILGRCTKGEECQLKHIEGYNDLIKEACKFYFQDTCYKGATCPYMHNILWSKLCGRRP